MDTYRDNDVDIDIDTVIGIDRDVDIDVDIDKDYINSNAIFIIQARQRLPDQLVYYKLKRHNIYIYS